MSRRVLTALAAGLFAAATLAPSVAHAWVPIDPSQPRWKTLPVTYKINQSTIPPSITNIAVARVDAAFATWGAPACSAWAAVDGGNTALSYNYNDGSNTIRWISQNWPAQLGDVNSVIGVTMPVWDGSGAIYDADIVFNDVGFNWNDSGSAGYVDTQSIATHEEGHFLGLGHTNVAGATMQPAYSGGTSLRTIEQDDITGVCTLYPSGNGTSAAATTSSGGGGDCQTCANSSVQGACSSQYQACGQQQDCVDFANCYGACSDQSCVDSCVNQHPSGAQTYSNMIDCICQDCSVECSAECGGGSSGSTTSGGSGTSGPSGATTGSGSGTGSAGATTSGGVGGAGAGSGGGSAASGWGNGGDDSSGSGDGAAIQQTPACACQTPGGGSAGGLGAVGLLAGLGLFFARRRR